MAKILITNHDRTKYLTGNLADKTFSFTSNIQQAFCFDNEREAKQFEEEQLTGFLADETTDLVDYNNPEKSIYST